MSPTREELQAYSLGKLDPQRASEVESHLASHPDALRDVIAAADDEVVRHLRGAGDLPTPGVRSPLLRLAVEGVLPVLAGCAGALAGGPEGGLVGVVVGQAAEKAINFFGQRIVNRWLEWLRKQPQLTRVAVLAELAELSPEVARREVTAALEDLAPNASPADKQAAIDYLGAIPRSVRRSLLSDRAPGGRTLPPGLSLDDTLGLLQLLPIDLPPYPAPTALPGTDYRLEELIGTGGFGAVYRASGSSLQHLPLAIKFCLDRSLLPALEQERANLERLMKAGGESWSPRIVRLYGYSLEHRTPYLVYEYVAGGDLVHWLAARQARDGRGLTPDEVLDLILQVAEALAFAHQRGLVHRDLKPANVLMGDKTIKLADFGIGGLAARQAVQGSRIGTAAASRLSPAEQASLFRGAGTPLYMSREQKQGEAPDPRHDLYSLGVMWYQLLVGDVTREMGHGWARELEVKFSTPRQHIKLIESCVGWIEDRPADAGELVPLLRLLQAPAGTQTRTAAAEPHTVIPDRAAETVRPPVPANAESKRSRHLRFVHGMRQLRRLHGLVAWWRGIWPVVFAFLLGVFAGYCGGFGVFALSNELLSNKNPHDDLSIAAGWAGGLAILGGFIWLGVWLRRKAVPQAEHALTARIDQLLAEFPQECQTWGGRAGLAEQEMVAEILRELEAPSR